MGDAQEKWFYDTLTKSKSRGAVWRVVGQQIVFTQLNQGGQCTRLMYHSYCGCSCCTP
jgi:alkaline phosphatase D